MSNIIIIYASTDGHTQEICQRLKSVIEEEHNKVNLLPIENSHTININEYDKIVIGASIRYGKHSPKVYKLIGENLQILNSKPNAFFSVNVVARKPEKNTPQTNPYLLKFLKQIAWKPNVLEVFAGKIDYQRYKWWDRIMIRLIMWMTKGPTDPKTNIEFTNWKQVETFGHTICEMQA